MATPKGGSAWCAANNCTNSRKKGWRMFRFPKDTERCKKWTVNTRREDLQRKTADYISKNCYLCTDHFEDNQFMNSSKQRLIWSAVPTIFHIPNPPPKLTSKRPLPTKRGGPPEKKPKKAAGSPKAISDLQFVPDDPSAVPSTSTASTVTVPNAPSPRKFKMKQELKSALRRCRRLNKSKNKYKQLLTTKTEQQKRTKESLIQQLADYLPEATLKFVSTKIRVGKIKPKGKRWTHAEKAMALSLLHASPKAYRMMGKLFSLPSVSTLRRTMRNVQIYPGFNDNILEALKKKLLGNQQGRLCVLAFDEMTLKEEAVYNIEQDNIEGLEDYGGVRTRYLANHATVFMARGIVSPWKQAVGYVLSSGPIKGDMLQSLLLSCIDKLCNVGMDVKAIVCDQGANNRNSLFRLGVREEKTYFLHNGAKVFVIYDPPHLVKNVRNNLKKTGFTREGRAINWAHIKEFFNIDSKNKVRMAPKLTRKHIHLPPFAALRVRFATQVLSHSVAAGLSTLVTLGHLQDDPEGAEETALFVERMDQLFNAFNSRGRRSNQKMRNALAENSGHKEFLLSTLDWLKTFESGSTRSLPCISGWATSIKSLLQLWEELHNHHGVQFLLTSRLNQDCVENLFSIIRGKGGHGDNPSPKQFREFLRMAMVDSILVQSKTSNCLDDGDHFLLNLDSITKAKDTTILEDELLPSQQEETNDVDALVNLACNLPDRRSVETDNVLTYISGFIAKKMCDKNTVCLECQAMLLGKLEETRNVIFLQKKQLPDLRGDGLTVPSDMLVDCVQHMEDVFQRSEDQMYKDRVWIRFLLRITKDLDSDSLLCPAGVCRLKNLAAGLFLNIRLHFALRDSNRKHAAASKRQNRKVLKFSHL